MRARRSWIWATSSLGLVVTKANVSRYDATECCRLRRSPKGAQVSSTTEVCGWVGRCPVRTQGSKVRFADIHVSHLSSGGTGVPGTLARACKSTVPGCSMRTVCLSASVPALGRTRHPFAVSGLEGPSQKIEFVFSASPETIRREPRECDLLRSVGKMQDLAVCAFFILLSSTAFMLPQSCVLQQA
jgi:hypothetical protein